MTLRSLAARYAWRGLRRHLRRTALSAAGVGIGCAIGLITIAWIRGESEMIVRAAAECGAGHLRVVPRDWPRKRDLNLRLSDWQHTLARLRALPEVKVATPRTRIQGLLGLGNRVASAEVVGVDASSEQSALRFVRHVVQGRYLLPGDRGAAVVGKALLERLDGQLGDELLLTVMDTTGEMRGALLTVVGVVATGSDNIDRALVQVPLADAAEQSGAPGAGEITVLLSEPRDMERVRARIAARLPAGQRVLRWYEVTPELRAGYEMDQGYARITIAIVIALVLLGVMSAQLTSVLERRREFAVLAALGMGGGQMVRIMLLESFSLGALGALIGLGVALPIVAYLALHGIRISDLITTGDMAVSGALLDPVLHADMGLWLVPYALLLSLIATVLAAFYPAIHATRTDPADALRVAQ
jgi:ABC-type lipoprotein release transport system permease subunit